MQEDTCVINAVQTLTLLSLNGVFFHIFQAKNPPLCGSTCFGYHHIHERLKKFVLEQRQLRQATPLSSGAGALTSVVLDQQVHETGPFFFAHFDLKNCYDSMLPGKLLEILKGQVLKHVRGYLYNLACSGSCMHMRNKKGSSFFLTTPLLI